MARHDPSSISDDTVMSAGESNVTDFAEASARSDKLRTQLKSSERLNEYYNQVVAELRASLEEIGEGQDRAS